MAKDKKVEQITNLEDDFAQWYTDICRKAELVEYASVKGFTILRPYGFAIWENMQRLMDAEFKKTGHENVAMPVLIPESLLKKEGELVNGFAPEVELVVVIAIMGILAGVGSAAYSGYVKKANEAADLQLLGAVNTAFASASYDAGQYDGRPSGGAASLDADGKVKKVISSVDRDGEFFQKYFSGNRDSRFKLYTNLAYDRATGTFHGAVLTAATDKDGNTVLHYSINGQDYEFTATREQLDAFRASTFGGKSMTMNDLTGNVGGMINALNSALGGGTFLASVLKNAGMNLETLGIKPDEKETYSELDKQRLANAALLLTASKTNKATAEKILKMFIPDDEGEVKPLNERASELLSLNMGETMSNVGAIYGIMTAFAYSEQAEGWAKTVDGKEYNAQEYYEYVS